jgi:hypothetical protein
MCVYIQFQCAREVPMTSKTTPKAAPSVMNAQPMFSLKLWREKIWRSFGSSRNVAMTPNPAWSSTTPT